MAIDSASHVPSRVRNTGTCRNGFTSRNHGCSRSPSTMETVRRANGTPTSPANRRTFQALPEYSVSINSSALMLSLIQLDVGFFDNEFPLLSFSVNEIAVFIEVAGVDNATLVV